MVDKYRFRENELIKELQEYVDATYSQHYSSGKIQAMEFIQDAGHGRSFAIGNVLKYAQRYGKKQGFNRADLIKTLHYALLALYCHDEDEYD